MSTAVMSNNSNKWEHVGKKKSNNSQATTRQSSIPTLQKPKAKDTKMPTIESLPPLKLEKTIYDVLNRDDDSSDDDNVKIPKSKSNGLVNGSSNSSNSSNNKQQATKSPKQQKPQQNSLRLTASSTTNQTSKKSDNDLDSILTSLNLNEFNQEYTTFLNLYPNLTNLPRMALNHMISFLNNKFNSIVDTDVAFNNENDLVNPLSKLDKNIVNFYTNLINKLNKSESEYVFEYVIVEILTDNKQTSNYGYKMVAQLLGKKHADISLRSFARFEKELTENHHKHGKCLAALWSIGQSGFSNLEVGLKIWFKFLIKNISVKHYTNLIISYLNLLLEQFKTKISNVKENEFLSLKDYLDFYELINDKAALGPLNKELNQKLQNSQKNLRDLIFKQSKVNYSDHFEVILQHLPVDSSSNKQDEILECAKLCLNYGKDTYTKWRQIYSKYLKQTQILIRHISKQWSEFKNINSSDLNQTLKYFEQNSLLYINSMQIPSKQQQQNNKNPIRNTKITKQQLNSNDLQQMQAINTLVKELVKEHISVKFSIMSKLFKFIVFVVLTFSLFFYWDINANKSIYTNEIKIQLEKLGLLDVTLHVIDYVKDLIKQVKSFLVTYIPPIYQKSRKTVVFYSTIAWDYTREYSTYAWKATESYRVTIYNYSVQALNYVQKHLPTLTDNLVSLFYLFLNYLSTLYNFLMHYFNLLINFVETQLFGWKRGELAIVFADGFKQMFKYLSGFFKWLNESGGF